MMGNGEIFPQMTRPIHATMPMDAVPNVEQVCHFMHGGFARPGHQQRPFLTGAPSLGRGKIVVVGVVPGKGKDAALFHVGQATGEQVVVPGIQIGHRDGQQSQRFCLILSTVRPQHVEQLRSIELARRNRCPVGRADISPIHFVPQQTSRPVTVVRVVLVVLVVLLVVVSPSRSSRLQHEGWQQAHVFEIKKNTDVLTQHAGGQSIVVGGVGGQWQNAQWATAFGGKTTFLKCRVFKSIHQLLKRLRFFSYFGTPIVSVDRWWNWCKKWVVIVVVAFVFVALFAFAATTAATAITAAATAAAAAAATTTAAAAAIFHRQSSCCCVEITHLFQKRGVFGGDALLSSSSIVGPFARVALAVVSKTLGGHGPCKRCNEQRGRPIVVHGSSHDAQAHVWGAGKNVETVGVTESGAKLAGSTYLLRRSPR